MVEEVEEGREEEAATVVQKAAEAGEEAVMESERGNCILW